MMDLSTRELKHLRHILRNDINEVGGAGIAPNFMLELLGKIVRELESRDES